MDQSTVILDANHEQKILYAPVKYNNNYTGLVFEIDDKTASVTNGYFIEIPSTYSPSSPIQFLSTFYLHNNNSLTAKITGYDLSNSFSWGLGYDKGEYKYKKIPEKVAKNNNETTRGQSNSRFDCVEYYLVTYYSDGSQDREYLGTVCNNCEQTRIIRNNEGNAFSVRCDGGSAIGGGGGSIGNPFTKITYTNKPLAVPTAATATITRLPNGKFQASINNNGLFLFCNVTINYTFDYVSKTLDQSSVTTNIGSGVFVGTWKQISVTNIYSYEDNMYFYINGSVTVTIPETSFQLVTLYTIKVDHYVPGNFVSLDNVETSSAPHKQGGGAN